MRNRVLVLGPDRPVVEALLRHDTDIVVVSGYAAYDAGAVRLPAGVRLILTEDQRSPESVLSALHRTLPPGRRFDVVHTSYEDTLVTAGVLAQVLGARGIDPRTAVLFRDKWLQKEHLRNAGIPTARSTFVPDIRGLEQASTTPYPTAVLKPVAGAATASTALVTDPPTLRALAVELRGQPLRQFVLEEHIDGDEWMVDGVVHAGQPVFYGLGRYHQPCLTALRERTPLRMRRLDPTGDAWAYAAADRLVPAVVEALGLPDGVFHMEVFHRPATDELLFSECAARRGGGLILQEIRHKFGVDLAGAAARAALGLPPDLTPRANAAAVGTTYLTSPPGILLRYPQAHRVARRPGVTFVRLDTPFGAVIADRAGDTNTRVGLAMLTADTPAELDTRMDDLTTWFHDHCVVVPADASRRELRDRQRHDWPANNLDDIDLTPASHTAGTTS